MQFIEISTPSDFSMCSLMRGIEQMRSAGVDDSDMRVITSRAVGFQDIMDVMNGLFGDEDVEWYCRTDTSTVMPLDSWMILDEKGRAMFWSPGA